MGDRYDVVVVGGGPAGSMTALHLARAGVRVILLEEKRMPRGKVCGEFITPEALPCLERAGLLDAVIRAGARRLSRLVLCPMNGGRVETAISTISTAGEWALSISRMRLDAILFEHAQAAGATCVERVAVKQPIADGTRAVGVEAVSLATGKHLTFRGAVVVDASGRNSRLTGGRDQSTVARGDRLFAMKAHISGIRDLDQTVALLFFPNGYGGISQIEGDLANVCFIARESVIRKHRGDGNAVLGDTMMMNHSGRDLLAGARVENGWLTVGPLVFGQRRLARAPVLAIGDAGGMNDPFTGTGIMMALRGGELAANAIRESLGVAGSGSCAVDPLDSASSWYSKQYLAEFARPMGMAAQLRRVAFSPRVANILAMTFMKLPRLAEWVLQRTRARSAHSGTFEAGGRVF